MGSRFTCPARGCTGSGLWLRRYSGSTRNGCATAANRERRGGWDRWSSGSSPVNGAVVYALVGALVFSEDALFVGFVLPGETAAVLGGVDASRGHIRLWLIILVVVAAAARVPPRSAGHESPAVVRRPACRQAPGAAAALVLHPRTAPAWRIPLRRPCRHG